MIKARPVAGDRAAGAAFLAELTPFLWRKHLDFAAIQDIHSIKRQIDAHRGGGAHQGRRATTSSSAAAASARSSSSPRPSSSSGAAACPSCAAPRTCDALRGAGRRGPHHAATPRTELTEAYRFLRRVEHRLQMVDDAQTHTLPDDEDGLRRIAIFLAIADAAAFAAALTARLDARSRAIMRGSSRRRRRSPRRGNLVFTGIEDDPDTLATLARPGLRRSARGRRRSCAAGITAATARRAASARASC